MGSKNFLVCAAAETPNAGNNAVSIAAAHNNAEILQANFFIFLSPFSF